MRSSVRVECHAKIEKNYIGESFENVRKSVKKGTRTDKNQENDQINVE
jgi:hypothetical protein